MGKKFILLGIGLSFLIGLNAQAKVTYLFDFDNTLFENREEFKGSFQTKVELYRIARRANLLQAELNSPQTIEVSWADFDRVLPFLSKNYESQGIVGKKITLSDGRIIEPANYYLRGNDSFKYFFSEEKSENYLIKDFTKALKIRGGNWKGQAWGLFQYLLSDPIQAKNVGIITMRGHNDKDFNEFFEHLTNTNERGQPLLANKPNLKKLLFRLSDQSLDKYTLDYSLGKTNLAKEKVIEDYIQMLGRTELTETDIILNPDGTKQEPYHFLVFAEDNQEALDRVARLFQKYSQNRIYKIKFGLINTGNKTEVKNSGRPQFAIIEAGGTFRAAREEEIIGNNDKKSAAVRCGLQLLKVGGS